MSDDPIMAEIRRYREEYAAKFNYDTQAILADIQKRQAESGRKVVSREPRRPAGDVDATGRVRSQLPKTS